MAKSFGSVQILMREYDQKLNAIPVVWSDQNRYFSLHQYIFARGVTCHGTIFPFLGHREKPDLGKNHYC